MLYDPPAGWKYGFPRPYRPLDGESLEQTLLRDGYPQHEIDNAGAKYCRFIAENMDEPRSGYTGADGEKVVGQELLDKGKVKEKKVTFGTGWLYGGNKK